MTVVANPAPGSTQINGNAWLGNPNLQLSFAANDQRNSASVNTFAVFSYGHGKTIEIDTTPIRISLNGEEQVTGSNAVTTVKQNDILELTQAVSNTVNPQTGERTTSTDTTQYTPTGQFGSRNATTSVASDSGLQLQVLNVTYNAQGTIKRARHHHSNQPDRVSSQRDPSYHRA